MTKLVRPVGKEQVAAPRPTDSGSCIRSLETLPSLIVYHSNKWRQHRHMATRRTEGILAVPWDRLTGRSDMGCGGWAVS